MNDFSRPFPFDLVGFDLDGTLLDTSGDLAAAVNHVLEAEGRATLTREAIVPMIGGGSRHMLGQALAATGGCDAALLDRTMPALLGHYEAHIAVHTRPYPGVERALDALAASGVRLAVVTNKQERLARTVLEATGLIDRFACVVGGDTPGVARGKPAPDPVLAMLARCGSERAVFVGDSIYDVEAAHAAGLPAVAVSFGYRTQPVDELGADSVIDRFDELVATLRTAPLGPQVPRE